MRRLPHASLALALPALALWVFAVLLPSDGLAQSSRRSRRERAKAAGKVTGKAPGVQTAQAEAQKGAPATPPQGQQGPPAPPALQDRPPAALRVECSDGMPAALCDAVREASVEAAARSYKLLEPARMEALFTREPALRSCRLEECRVAITAELSAPRLIDVHIHAGGRGGLVGSVSIYDAAAKGISGDTDAPLGRRDDKHVRRVIGDAIDYVVGAQRLTATLHLDVQPEGATVKIDDKDRGAVRDVKLFLGPHRVRVEKVGYLPAERTVNVTPAGTREQIKLQPQPIRVMVEVLPAGTRVLVDGDPVDARTSVVELVEGKHRVQALAPPDSGYDSLDFEIDVRVGMQPVRRVLPRLAQLRISAPRGYTVRVDNQMMLPGREAGTQQELTVTASPGTHQVTAESWRGRLLKQSALVVPGTAADIRLRPPSLVPGLVLAGVGIVGLAAGGAMVGLHGQCSSPNTAPEGSPRNCESVYDFSWQRDAVPLQPPVAGYLTLGLGGAALIVGTVWFAVNAADHPLLHRRAPQAGAARRPRTAWPVIAPTATAHGGALVVQGGF